MNKAYDYNGTVVSPSKPVRELRTVKKTLLIDSADRDTVKYYTNGDVVYYLPRVYENVVCIRLKSATFPRIVDDATAGAIEHSYVRGQNRAEATWTVGAGQDTKVTGRTNHYFLIEMEGLNKSDETTVSAERSTYPDSFYAKIPTTMYQNGAGSFFIEYNDHTHGENIAYYTPAIGKLDRLHVITRLHSQQNKSGFIYWTSDGEAANGDNNIAGGSNYSLEFEITMLENSFDDFSSFETRISTRAETSNSFGHYGC